MSNFSAILERLRELEESGHGDTPISAMSRAELIDYLGASDAEVASMSDDELRDAAEEKTSDVAEGEECNHTPEGEECPEHGLAECGSMMVTMGEGYTDEEHYVDRSFNKMLDFVSTVTKMVEKPRLADTINNIGGDPSSLSNIKQKLDDLYDNVEQGHYEAMAHLDMEESQDTVEECGDPVDMREQRLVQRVNELTQRLQSFKEQLAEMDPAPQDPEEIKKQQTITTNLNQMKAAGVDIDPAKGTEDPAFNKEVGDKVAAAMADPALGQQLKGVLGKVKD